MEKTKILIVEDESIVAFDIRRRLVRMGYAVAATVDTAELAISGAQEYRPDLILMDIKLKGDMDGIRAAEIIHERLDLPVLFLTANADEATIRRTRQAHAFGYILKPFEERELSTNIEMALFKHKTERALRENQAYLQTIFQTVPDGIFIFDETGACVDINPAGCAMLGCTREELSQVGVPALFWPGSSPLTPAQVSGSAVREVHFSTRSGAEIWAELTLAPLTRSGQPGILGILHEITARKQMEISLRASEERYMLAAQGANDGLWDWDIRDNHLYLSARCKEMLGYQEHGVLNEAEDWRQLIHPEDFEQVSSDLAIHLQGLTPFFRNEMRLRTRVGSYCWVLARGLAVRGPDRVAYRMAGSLTDITERVQSTQQLEHDAFHDSLTGLPNRALLLDRLSQAMERAHRNSQYHYAVLFMDLDGFKAVNDHLGHAAGDRLLIEIARRLKQTLRSCDTLARLGGDEFVALIEETNGPADGTIVAERFLEQFQAPFELDGKPMCTSASIGIVAGSGQYEGAEKILRDADVAMYQAKSAGKARFELFSGSFSAGLTA